MLIATVEPIPLFERLVSKALRFVIFAKAVKVWFALVATFPFNTSTADDPELIEGICHQPEAAV